MGKKIRFSKSEMSGFIVLLILLVSVALLLHYEEIIFSEKDKISKVTPEELKEMEAFAQQIKADSAEQENKFNNRATKHTLKPFAFDPNTADSASLIKLGLHNWQVENLLKYRRKGGRWKKPEDFARLYGLSKEDFETLKPYIYITKTKSEIAQEQRKAVNDSLHRTYPKKYAKGTQLSLNDVDTTALKGIPGIGSYYASKITKYRERLGGFINIEQLKEIEGLPEDIESWFTLSPNPQIRKTRINQTDFKGLVRHPYLNYEQVKVICNYIRKYGKIKSWEELSNSKLFTEEDFKRLDPYFTFE